MSVRFVIGRAGSGKTHHCLDSIQRELKRNRVDGPRLIFLVPEQASLQMERSIAESVSAAHRLEVLSFQRLAFRVLEHVGHPPRAALTETARAMVLRHLIVREAPRLRYYRRVTRHSGFIERLSATLVEFIQENVAAEQLVESLAAPPEEGQRDLSTKGDSDPAHAAKLHDLGLIYAAYLSFLETGCLDPSQHLQLARGMFGRCEWLSAAHLWVDGFASFSEQEMLTLLELARRCARTDVTVLLDPAAETANSEISASQRLFGRTGETFRKLRARFKEVGVEEVQPLILNAPLLPRFSVSRALASIERSIFQGGPGESSSAAGAHGVELIELPSRRVEVDHAVSRVCEWVRDAKDPLRYRDIALIVRDLDPYHDLLSDALRTRGIPFFIDRRRTIAHHPLVELIRAAAALAIDDLSLDAVRLLLKTDLVPIGARAADGIENHILARGIEGRDKWSRDWVLQSPTGRRRAEAKNDHLERQAAFLNKTRRRLLELLDSWLHFAQRLGGHAGKDWAAAIRELCSALDVPQTMCAWAETAERRGDVDQAEEHRQAWNATMSLLDDLAFALPEAGLSLAEIGEVLESGLNSLTLGLAPPTVDQVLVGSIERSRHPDIKAAVILGFNDAVFPKRLSDDTILNDEDRETLRGRGVIVGPPARERMLDESLLVYIALTRPSRRLVVSYAASDDAGKALRPSPFIEPLCAACPGLQLKVIGDPVRNREFWDIQSSSDLRRRLVEELRARPAAAHDVTATRARWNTLYLGARRWLQNDPAARRAFAALDEHEDTQLSPATLDRLFGKHLQNSVSGLETYAACPFQFFAKAVLRLKQRAEAVLEPVDIGTVHHAILENFTRRMTESNRAFSQLSEGDVEQGLRESCRDVGRQMCADGLHDARNSYVLRRSAERLARIMNAQRRRSAGGRARTSAVELPFGFDSPGGLPAIELTTPKKRQVSLRGFIDRVDLIELTDEVLGIVVDYKKSKTQLDLGKVYHGLSLQLPAYLLALAESGTTLAGRPIQPVAALYVSLSPRYKSVDHPGLLNAREAGLAGTSLPRGVLLGEKLAELDSEIDGWSANYSAYRKKDGGFGHLDSTDVAAHPAFDNMLSCTRRKLGELADAVLDGDMPVKPYRIGLFRPCHWCAMHSVCRMELGITESRFVDRLKRSEVFRRWAEPAAGA